MDSATKTRIVHAVDDGFDAQNGFLAEQSASPSPKVNAPGAQDVMALEMGARDIAVDRWQLEDGDWKISVSARLVFDLRMDLFPGQDMGGAKAENEEIVMPAAGENAGLRNGIPNVSHCGFEAEGYALAEADSLMAPDAIGRLEAANHTNNDTDLDPIAVTATTDARSFGLYANASTLVCGAKAGAIHGFNERLSLDTIRHVTEATALFIANSFGIETI